MYPRVKLSLNAGLYEISLQVVSDFTSDDPEPRKKSSAKKTTASFFKLMQKKRLSKGCCSRQISKVAVVVQQSRLQKRTFSI